MSETTQTTTEPETSEGHVESRPRYGAVEIYYKQDGSLEIDRIHLDNTGGLNSRIYFDERQYNQEPHRIFSHERLFKYLFEELGPLWDFVSHITTDLSDLFGLSSAEIYSYHGEHIPSHLRDLALSKDPIAREFFIRHPEQKIPEVLIPQVMAGRIKPFVKEQLELLPDANANHATIYKLLLHQWLTASLDEANFTLERAAIFEKILAYGIDQFSADVSASRIWGGVLSPTAYRQPATGNWTLSYSDGNALATDDTMLANAGLASDPNSNYSKAYSIVYPPTEPLGRGD